MSYRAFKRLMGETSLERKCRFLFGTGVIVLITVSFWLYAYQTELLAYDQAVTTCRLLVGPTFYQHHDPLIKKEHQEPANKAAGNADHVLLKEPGKEYQYHFLSGEKFFEDSYERELYKEFLRPDGKLEDHRRRDSDQVLLYYAPIRAAGDCMKCHQELAKKKGQELAEGDMLAMVRIRMPTKSIEEGVHWNRALLVSTAITTVILIMIGSWIIVRYIIVKPVKHLKEVSDAISAGKLNVRSEIQTGDEFEDLSHAFNRMLRHLVSMQDQWRKVNADLDRKVDELAQTNMALFESNKLKGDFLATMSHELRTPLNSILGFSDVLLAKEDALTDKQRRWVSNIQSSGQRLLALINDILELAKMEAGKMQLHLENFNLHDVCDGLLNMARPLAEKKNIDLRSQLEPDIPTLRQDISKLQQILQNLLSNAIKFTPEGGRVAIKAEADTKFITIAVIDTGVGVAKDEQELVFQKFRQSGNPLTREHEGTGLGLSIVRELCKLMGGEVTLHSELGRGSTFTVRLPMQLSEEPRLEFDLAAEQIELAKAQRVDARVYAGVPTRVERHEATQN